MITVLRKSMKKRGFKIVLWITLLSMIVVFFPGLFQKRMGIPMALTINGDDVTFEELQQQINHETQRINLLRQRFGPQADTLLRAFGLNDPQYIALQSVIQQTLLNNVADTMNLHMTPDIVLAKLHDPYFVMEELTNVVPLEAIDSNGFINLALLERILAYRGVNMADFEQQVEDVVRRNTVLNLAGSAVYVSPEEVRDHYKTHYLDKKYSILKFPLSKYEALVKEKGLSDSAIKAFYEKENKKNKRYWVSEKRSGQRWVFSPQDYNISVSDEEIKQYYSQYKRKRFMDKPVTMQIRSIQLQFKDPEKVQDVFTKAKDIKEQLAKDSSLFASLAQQYSDDKQSASKGGLSDFFKRGDKNPNVETAAFRLKNDNDVSDIIRTDEGLYIIQRVARTKPVYKELENVKSDIKEILVLNRFKQKFSKDMRNIAYQLQKNAENFDNKVVQYKAKEEEIALSSQEPTKESEALFKLKPDGWNYYIANGKGYVIHVSKIEKAHAEDLNVIKDTIKQDLYLNKAKQAQQAAIKKALIQARTSSPAQVAKDFAVSMESTDWVSVDDKAKQEALIKQGFPINEMLQIEYPGDLTSAELGQNGFVVQLDAIASFDEKDFEAKKQEITDTLYQDQVNRIKRSLVASLYRNAKIEINERINNSKGTMTL